VAWHDVITIRKNLIVLKSTTMLGNVALIYVMSVIPDDHEIPTLCIAAKYTSLCESAWSGGKFLMEPTWRMIRAICYRILT